jgi:hypothetical protein
MALSPGFAADAAAGAAAALLAAGTDIETEAPTSINTESTASTENTQRLEATTIPFEPRRTHS